MSGFINETKSCLNRKEITIISMQYAEVLVLKDIMMIKFHFHMNLKHNEATGRTERALQYSRAYTTGLYRKQSNERNLGKQQDLMTSQVSWDQTVLLSRLLHRFMKKGKIARPFQYGKRRAVQQNFQISTQSECGTIPWNPDLWKIFWQPYERQHSKNCESG